MDITIRIWDKENKRMIPSDDVSLIDIERKRVIYHSDYGNGPRKEITMADSWIGYELIELMQYTGLKDKNGVDIYEGDILQGLYHFPGVGWYDTGEGDYRIHHPVKFEKGKFICHIFMIDEVADSVEVIGNIYENKELVTQEGIMP